MKKIENKVLLLLILLVANLFVVFALPNASANLQVSQILPSHGTISMDGSLIPVLGGWGGIRLYETILSPDTHPDNPDSSVFAGERASNAEMVMRRLKDEGFNTIRAYFESQWGENAGYEDWGWNPSWFERFVTLAKHYDLWMIVDYHGYNEPYEHEESWISFWQTLITRYKDLYDKLAWEPCNEPLIEGKVGQAAVDELTRLYQRWIDMCRGLGDTHWIIVSGVYWWNQLPEDEWFPVVNDPLEKTFLSYHWYYFYDYHRESWTVQGAEAHADHIYEVAVSVMNKYNKPFIMTESGASCGVPPSPDAIYNPNLWSPISLAFLQRLVNNFDTHTPRIGYIFFSGGDWSRAGLYGDMRVWGYLLAHEQFPSS